MTVPLTLLKITPLSGADGLSVYQYAGRNLTQTLEPIMGGGIMGTQVRRDINGNLINLTYPQFRKYSSTISCTDHNEPAFSRVWFGQVVDVECAKELNYYTTTGSPERSVVSSRVEGDYTFYRPALTMMIVGMRSSFAEWKSEYNWQIELQEV